MPFTVLSQIDNRSGSFKIPATENPKGTPTPVPDPTSDLPESKKSIGGLQLDANGKLMERPVLRCLSTKNMQMPDSDIQK